MDSVLYVAIAAADGFPRHEFRFVAQTTQYWPKCLTGNMLPLLTEQDKQATPKMVKCCEALV